MSGFSQGCALALHTFYEMAEKVDYVIGIGGSMFPFTKFRETEQRVRVIHGKTDSLRPW